MLPKNFRSDYLTQQMAMKVGSKMSVNDFYAPSSFINTKIKRLLCEPIEKESGRSLPDVWDYIKNLDVTDFSQKCKKFSK